MSNNSKKQKVIHTRVSENLEKDLKTKAAQLGISVSNLVRNVLVNTAELVENVVVDSARIANPGKNITSSNSASVEPSSTIIGWQELILNLNAICFKCNAILQKGSKAAVALPINPKNNISVCLDCLGKLSSENGENKS
jgi:hypothetical protein